MPTQYSRLSVLFLLVFVTAGFCQAQFPPPVLTSLLPAQPSISITSSLVVLPVKVTDEQGNSVFGLGEKDFRVFDEKQAQQLSLFQTDRSPVSIGLIVDHSASMKTKLPSVISAVSAFVATSDPRDEMFVVNFNDNIVMDPKHDFTSNSREIEKSLSSITPIGRTALYDAVAQGLLRLHDAHWSKKALIVVSDGGDNASSYNKSELVTLARKSQVSIYSIVLIDNVSSDQNPRALRQIAKDTGGVAFSPEKPELVPNTFSVIARDLREEYVLGFRPETRAQKDEFRKIRVELVAPQTRKVQIRTRTGYFPDQPSTSN